MLLDSLGSSPSQIMATWSARLAKWRSMQLSETLVVPSPNHSIETLPGANDVRFTRVYGLIQSMRFPWSPQKPSGSRTDWAYISRYLASSAWACPGQFSGTLYSISDMFRSSIVGTKPICDCYL